MTADGIRLWSFIRLHTYNTCLHISLFISVSQVGFAPFLHRGVPWQFTFEDLDSIDLSGQTALVTGANAGIGYAMSEHLYRMGAEVTLACRNPLKCEAAASQIRENNSASCSRCGNIKTGTIDTATLASVKEFAMNYLREADDQPLDMLFLNAGTQFTNPDYKCVPASVDGIEQVFAANYLGHHLLFRLLEPALQKSKFARVVSTSSNSCFNSYSYQVATDLETLNGCSEKFGTFLLNRSYGQSKLAQVVWTKYLARRYSLSTSSPHSNSNNVYINAFHPGIVASQMAGKALTEARAPEVLLMFSGWLASRFFWTAAEGALTGLFLGTAVHRLQSEHIQGKYYHPQAQEVVNPIALNETLQDRLWEFSEELVKDFL